MNLSTFRNWSVIPKAFGICTELRNKIFAPFCIFTRLALHHPRNVSKFLNSFPVWFVTLKGFFLIDAQLKPLVYSPSTRFEVISSSLLYTKTDW